MTSAWLLRPVISLTTQQFLDALAFHQRYQVSHWDGLILAAAKKAHCTILYTEDLKNKQVYDGIKVINPFAQPKLTAPLHLSNFKF